MTRKRLIVSLATISAFLLWTGKFAAGWFPLTVPAAPAAVVTIQGAPQPPDQTIMIGYESADVRIVIAQMAKILGMDPIQVDPQIDGRVTIHGNFSKQQLLDFFNTMLQNNKARLVKTTDGYRVMSIAPPTAASPGKPAAAAPQATATREPIRVGGNVQQTKLIYKVDPVYPELAKRARVSGTVILTVTVDEQGNVTDVNVLQGHPLLDQAAIAAVRQ